MTAGIFGSRAIRGRSVWGSFNSPIAAGRGKASRPALTGVVTLYLNLDVTVLTHDAKRPQNVSCSLLNGLIKLVREGNGVDCRFSETVSNLGVLVFEGEIYDCPKLRSRVVLLDFRSLVDNLVDALVKIAPRFYPFDVYGKLDVAVGRKGGVDLEALTLHINLPFHKLPPAPSGERVGDALLPTTLYR